MSAKTKEEMEKLEEQANETANKIKEANENIRQALREQYEHSQNNLETTISNLEKQFELLDLANDSIGKTSNRENRINNLTFSIQKAYKEIDRLRAEDEKKNADTIQTEIDRVYDATKRILDLRKEQYQAEYDELNRYVQMRDSLENWLVGEKQRYIKKTEKLVKDSYAKGLIDAKAYIEQLSEVYTSEFDQYQTEQQRLQQAAISAIEKEIKAIEKAQDVKVDALEEEIDLLEKRKEELENQLDLYDRAKSAVDTLIDEETDRLQEEIDKLEEKNNQQTKAIELAEKQQALAKAEQQKSSYIYREGSGWGYESNAQDLADAQNDLWEYQRQQQYEAEKQAIQDRIDALEKYKDKWQEAVDAYEKAQDKIAASAVIGKDWEEYVLGLREDIVKKFGDEYYKLSDELENAVDKRIDALNKEKDEITDNASKQIDKLNDLKEAWSEALDIQDEIEGYTGGLTALIGAENDSYESRLALAEKFAENYKNTFQDLQATTQRRIESLYKETQTINDLLGKAGIPLYNGDIVTSNTTSSKSNSNGTLTNNDIYILRAMRNASQTWAKTTDEATRKQLEQYNQTLSKMLSFNANFDSHKGTWTDDNDRLLYDLLKAYENGETVTVKNNKSQDTNTNALNKTNTAINSSTQKNVTAVNSNSKNILNNSTKITDNSDKTNINSVKTDINTDAINGNTSQIGQQISSNSSVIASVDALTDTIPELKDAIENIKFSTGDSNSSSSSDLGLNAIAEAYGDKYVDIQALLKEYNASLNGNILTLSNGVSYQLLGNGNFQRLSSSNSINSGNSSNSGSSNSSGNQSNSSSNGSSASSSGKMTDSEALATLKTQYGSKAYTNKVYGTGYEGAKAIVSANVLSESNPSKYFVVKRQNEYNIYKAQWGDGTNSTKVSKTPIGHYAKGTTGVIRDQYAVVDEQGEELLVHARHGRATYLTKGTGVVPHDLTENLMELGKNPTEYIKNTVIASNLYKNIMPDIPVNNKKNNDTVIQINGNLSFPNINNGDDAKKLIRGLCGLATQAKQRSLRR